MGDVLGKFVVILFGIFFIFYIPITIIALKQDAQKQTYIDDTVTEFVDNARATGKIAPAEYEHMVERVFLAESPCTIEIFHGAKYVTVDATDPDKYVTGSDYFTKQEILDVMYPDENTAINYEMKNGDYIKVTVNNDEPSLGTSLLRVIVPSTGTQSLFTSYGGFVGNNMQ